MKLITYEYQKQQKAGILLDEKVLDIRKAAAKLELQGNFDTMLEILQNPQGLDALKFIKEQMSELNAISLNEVQLLAPVPNPGKILGAALNYRDFCVRGNLPVPASLKVFGKFSSTVSNPGEAVNLQGHKVTYEGELGVVVGKRCKGVTEENAMEFVAGYTVVNDLTANDYIKEDVQLFRGKNLDGFFPMGPVLVTADDIQDPGNLDICTRVNGKLLQNSNTSQLIFGIPRLISYFSSFLTIEPGDIIATGTPAGTALQFDPPRFLQPDDHIEITVQGIGTLAHTVCGHKQT